MSQAPQLFYARPRTEADHRKKRRSFKRIDRFTECPKSGIARKIWRWATNQGISIKSLLVCRPKPHHQAWGYTHYVLEETDPQNPDGLGKEYGIFEPKTLIQGNWQPYQSGYEWFLD